MLFDATNGSWKAVYVYKVKYKQSKYTVLKKAVQILIQMFTCFNNRLLHVATIIELRTLRTF